jgi:hypothetical protein
MKSLALAAMVSVTGCCLEIVEGFAERTVDGGEIDVGSDGGTGCTPDSGATIYAHSQTDLYKIDPVTWTPVDPETGEATTVGAIGYQSVWGLGYYGGTVIAFTDEGQILKIDPTTGAGTLLSSSSVQYWGAGVTPAVAANCP